MFVLLFSGKCVKVQKKAGQASGPDGLTKHSPTYKRSCPAGSGGVTVPRPLRERLIHLLALKPYRKPDLLLWLERERASPREKAELAPLLEEVGAAMGRYSHPQPGNTKHFLTII